MCCLSPLLRSTLMGGYLVFSEHSSMDLFAYTFIFLHHSMSNSRAFLTTSGSDLPALLNWNIYCHVRVLVLTLFDFSHVVSLLSSPPHGCLSLSTPFHANSSRSCCAFPLLPHVLIRLLSFFACLSRRHSGGPCFDLTDHLGSSFSLLLLPRSLWKHHRSQPSPPRRA